uniref:Uncharacterized protein n=1 Tax=Setaria italica TaxID=4555 RepID=K3Y4F4_SETIT
MCPHSDQLDRSLDWRQLAVPFLEWQVSSDESSSELVREYDINEGFFFQVRLGPELWILEGPNMNIELQACRRS